MTQIPSHPSAHNASTFIITPLRTVGYVSTDGLAPICIRYLQLDRSFRHAATISAEIPVYKKVSPYQSVPDRREAEERQEGRYSLGAEATSCFFCAIM